MKSYDIDNLPDNIKKLMNPYGNVFGNLSYIGVEIYNPKDQVIYFDKDITRLRFLLEGKAKICLIHENGNQSIVHFVHPGEFVGELTFLEIEKEHKNIFCISECTFISVDMDEARRILKSDSDFLYKLSQFIGDKMLRRTSFNSKNQNYELRNRLAAYILETQHNDIYNEKHTETAEYLAVSYRHLLYTFKEFIDDGLLIKLKKGYKINQSGLSLLSKDITIL